MKQNQLSHIVISPYMFQRKVCKELEINQLQTLNQIKQVWNRDNSDYVTTNTWKPLFMKMRNH